MTESFDEKAEKAISYFTTMRSRYEQLVDEVVYALSEYVPKQNIETSEILGRAKSLASFKEKIARKAYSDPFQQMRDLAAARVVCLFESDLQRVKDIVVDTFQVIELEDKSEGLGDDLMGYQGYHLVVRLGDKFSGPRYDEIKELYCEIQVRTVLQDAWSKISHKLVYKSEASIPRQLRRNLNNVSSLMEIAQSVFDTVKVGQEEYMDELRRTVEAGEDMFSQEINHHTLMEYSAQKFEKLPVSEYWQDQLIADLDLEKYKTIGDLDAVVSKALPLLDDFARNSPEMFRHSTDFITKAFGLLDSEFEKKHSFGSPTIHALKKIRKSNKLS